MAEAPVPAASEGARERLDDALRAEVHAPSSFLRLLAEGDEDVAATSTKLPAQARSTHESSDESLSGKQKIEEGRCGRSSSSSSSNISSDALPPRGSDGRKVGDAPLPPPSHQRSAGASFSRNRLQKASADDKVSHRPPAGRAAASSMRHRDESPNQAAVADTSATEGGKMGSRRRRAATAVTRRHALTHDEMLAAKLNELREIMSLDVNGLEEFLRHGGPEADRHPPPPQRASRVRRRLRKNSSGSAATAAPNGKTSDASVVLANSTGAAHHERSRSRSEQRRVQFVVPALDLSDDTGSGCDRELAATATAVDGKSLGGESGGRSPPTTGSECHSASEESTGGRSSASCSSGATAAGTERSEDSAGRGDGGGDSEGSAAPSSPPSDDPAASSATQQQRRRRRRSTDRSAERAHASETDLHHAASADVRRWLRRKEVVIRKMKRQQREEERQKELAAAAESEAKDERRRLASAAMRAWIRNKRHEQGKRKAGRPSTAASASPEGATNGEAAAAAASGQQQSDVPKGTASTSEALSTPATAAATTAQPGGQSAGSALHVKEPRARQKDVGAAQEASGDRLTKAAHESVKAAAGRPSGTAAPASPSSNVTRPQRAASAGRSEKRPQSVPTAAVRGRPAGEQQEVGGKSKSSASSTGQNDSSKKQSDSSAAVDARQQRPPQAHKPPLRSTTSSPAAPAAAAKVSSQRPDAAGEASSQGIRSPPKAAAARKSYDEWLRNKVLGRSDASTAADSSADAATPRASDTDALPPQVVRDAARRRLEKITRGRTPPPHSPSRSAAAPDSASPESSNRATTSAAATPSSATSASAMPSPSPTSAPSTERSRRPFKWKPATGILLDQQIRQQQQQQQSTAAQTTAAASPPRQRRATPSAAAAGGAERVRRAGGGIDVNAETPDENPFRVPFPTLRRPRSSLERASFRGPEFAAYVHKLVSDEFRPEPQGSETPEPAVEEPTTKRGAAEAKRENEGAKTGPAAAAPRRCFSPDGAASAGSPMAMVRTAKDRVPELSLLDSDEIFALTSLQTP